MERIVLDIDYSRNPEALMKAINVMGKRLDLTLMNAPQALEDLKQKGFARIEGKDADIMSCKLLIQKELNKLQIMIYRIWIKIKHACAHRLHLLKKV